MYEGARTPSEPGTAPNMEGGGGAPFDACTHRVHQNRVSCTVRGVYAFQNCVPYVYRTRNSYIAVRDVYRAVRNVYVFVASRSAFALMMRHNSAIKRLPGRSTFSSADCVIDHTVPGCTLPATSTT